MAALQHSDITAAKIAVRMVSSPHLFASGCLWKSVVSPPLTRRSTLPLSVSVYSSSSTVAAPCSADVLEVTGLKTSFPVTLVVLGVVAAVPVPAEPVLLEPLLGSPPPEAPELAELLEALKTFVPETREGDVPAASGPDVDVW